MLTKSSNITGAWNRGAIRVLGQVSDWAWSTLLGHPWQAQQEEVWWQRWWRWWSLAGTGASSRSIERYFFIDIMEIFIPGGNALSTLRISILYHQKLSTSLTSSWGIFWFEILYRGLLSVHILLRSHCNVIKASLSSHFWLHNFPWPLLPVSFLLSPFPSLHFLVFWLDFSGSEHGSPNIHNIQPCPQLRNIWTAPSFENFFQVRSPGATDCTWSNGARLLLSSHQGALKVSFCYSYRILNKNRNTIFG